MTSIRCLLYNGNVNWLYCGRGGFIFHGFYCSTWNIWRLKNTIDLVLGLGRGYSNNFKWSCYNEYCSTWNICNS